MIEFDDKQEAYDYIEKYVNLVSSGNIYNLTYEQQEYLMDNNLQAKFLLDFENWNNKGGKIIKGQHAYRLPNGNDTLKLFDVSQTSYRMLANEPFNSLAYDYKSISKEEMTAFINYFMRDYEGENRYEMAQLLGCSLVQKFAYPKPDLRIEDFIEDPESIDLEAFSSMNREMFNYTKLLYNESKEGMVRLSTLVKRVIKEHNLDLGGEQDDRTEMDTSNERENGISQGSISSQVSRDERQWNIDASLKTSKRGMGQSVDGNEETLMAEMGEGSQYEDQQTSDIGKHRGHKPNNTTSIFNSEGNGNLHSNIEKESEEETSLFKTPNYTQTSLFDDAVNVEIEETRQEEIENQKDIIENNDSGLDVNFKEWYHKAYPNDTIYNDLPDDITFNNIYDFIQTGESFYSNVIGDSVVRERCFSELANILNKDYQEIYDLYANDDKHVKITRASIELDPVKGVVTHTTRDNENVVENITDIEPTGKTINTNDLVAGNYHIDDLKVGFGKPRERYKNNVEAIKLLKQLDKENRPATKEEQETLSKYVGWGGLSEAFDKSKWPNEYEELKDLLDENEYKNALASVNTSFFTQPAVIDSVYKALDKFGFKKGNVLEPSCGVGNFFGRLPESMKDSTLYGVELDNISAKIAQKLYPNAYIENKGYEKTEFDDNFFDVAIGNVPFGDIPINDPRYNKENFLIHDYFFAKTIDKVRPNGVIALITSKGTLDKQSSKAREYIAKRCDLIGAIRLPKETFKGNAGTEAISDIIFLTKKKTPNVNMPSWVTSNKDNFMYVDYFKEYMSKAELEQRLLDITLNDDTTEYNQLQDYIQKVVDDGEKAEGDDYHYYGYFRRNELHEEQHRDKSVKDYWKGLWEAPIGEFKGPKYNPFNRSGRNVPWDAWQLQYYIKDIYKWYQEKPEEVIEIVAKSGKFKTSSQRQKGDSKVTDKELELARQFLESGDGCLLKKLKSDYFGQIENIMLEQIEYADKETEKTKDEDGYTIDEKVVKEGMATQPINTYFAENKDMVIGDMKIKSSQFGYDTDVSLANEDDLANELDKCIDKLDFEYVEDNTFKKEANTNVIHADQRIENYTFGIIDDKLYYRTGGVMEEITKDNKDYDYDLVKDLISLKNSAKNVINAQLDDCTDEELKTLQDNLNYEYDTFVEKHDYIYKNNDDIKFLISMDSSLTLTTSLEDYDYENQVLKGKMPIFSERTIHKQETNIEHCETSEDALIVSLQKKAKVDIDYMLKLTGKSKEELLNDLDKSIYRDYSSEEENYIPADELLSGNVKEKYKEAESIYNNLLEKKETQETNDYDERLAILKQDMEALKSVFPEDIPADLVTMQVGTRWIPPKIYQRFMNEVLLKDNTRYSYRNEAAIVRYSPILDKYEIENKTSGVYDSNASLLTEVYGMNERGHNALDILETTLNMGAEKVYDHYRKDGVNKSVLNKTKTIIAQQKQEDIKKAFVDWLNEPENKIIDENDKEIPVKEYLANIYNEKYNAIVNREYDPRLVNPIGMAISKDSEGREKKLYPHQKQVIAKALFGGNTGIFHSVGAGKTLSMITIAMESKRLGLCNKSLFVCPKSIVGQWGKEFLANYPTANILVADDKSFSKENRGKFITKIATGNYDAVIVSTEQFGLLKLSDEREEQYMEDDMDKIREYIEEQKRNYRDQGRNFSIKKAEQKLKKMQTALEKRHEMKKDDYIDFEQLGIDKLFIDESHNFKNLAFDTALSRVKGVGGSSDSLRSNDLLYKARYLNELTGNKGLIFASGTPVSNTLSELYTIQRYLQPDTLRSMGIDSFDRWASTFAEVVEDKQVAVTGDKYEEKAIIKKYHNIPELMAIFKEIADIRTNEDMQDYLKLPAVDKVPIEVPRTEEQTEYLQSLSDRVDKIRSQSVDRHVDNMLKVTQDGRNMALDQRIVGLDKPEGTDTKSNYIAENVYKEYINSNDIKGTQFIFSDISVPKDGSSNKKEKEDKNIKFDIYNDIKKLLIEKGIPEEEIAFIHDYKSDDSKLKLFRDINSGKIRVVMGSTQKLGTGVNAQERAVALHHCDVPWKPSDIEQREGRIVRTGNMNQNVRIYNYITKDTFDSYSWQTIQNKATFISQLMRSKISARDTEDIGNMELQASQLKAMATGNPMLQEHMDLENEIRLLTIQKNDYIRKISDYKKSVTIELPEKIKFAEERLENIKADLETFKANKPEKIKNANGNDEYKLNIVVDGKTYTEYKKAGEALQAQAKKLKYPQDLLTLTNPKGKVVGNYLGFDVGIACSSDMGKYYYIIGDKNTIVLDSTIDPSALSRKIVNSLDTLERSLKEQEDKVEHYKGELEFNKGELAKPFDKEKELAKKQQRFNEITEALQHKDREEENEYIEEHSADLETNEDVDDEYIDNEDEEGYEM